MSKTSSTMSHLAICLGKGLIAGIAGTAVMTVLKMMEMKAMPNTEKAGDAPAQAAGKVMGVQPRNPEGRQRFGQMVHWAYGTSWGIMRGLVCFAGVKGIPASILHFGAIWGTELVIVPALTNTPPPTKWSFKTLGADAAEHAAYAATAGAIFDYMD